MRSAADPAHHSKSRIGDTATLLFCVGTAIVIFGLALAIPMPVHSTTVSQTSTSQSTTQTAGAASIKLSTGSEPAGVPISISGQGLTPNYTITAAFGSIQLPLSGTCITNPAGELSGCTFVVPHAPPGKYSITFHDKTHVVTDSFTIPVITIPESTLLVTVTSIGLSLVTQLVTRRVVDLDAERRMKSEVGAFNKEKREATLAKDKAKLEKLKKKELPMRQEQAKVSSARLKVTAITFIPLLGVYYLMASFLGGFNVVVAYSPIPIPLLVGTNTDMALFWWYMLSSFTFSSVLTRLLRTTT